MFINTLLYSFWVKSIKFWLVKKTGLLSIILFFVLILFQIKAMKTKFLVYFFSLLYIGVVFSQAPQITYNTPNTFSINESITPLVPINTGGNVPNEPIVSTYAGTGSIGSVDGSLLTSSFNLPTISIFDNNQDLIVVDRSNNKIRKIANGQVTTIAGTGALGSVNGVATSSTFRYPDGAVVASDGTIYISDQSNHKIRKFTTDGMVSNFVGTNTAGYVDGNGTNARFNYPAAMAIDTQDNLYVADWGNHCIRKITPTGDVTTYAGIGGVSGDLDGNTTIAKFNGPTGLCLDNFGNVYVADYSNHKIRKIDVLGNVITFVGTGIAGNVDGNASNATLNLPAVVAFDGIENFYVTDSGNRKVRKIDAQGNVTTFAGTGEGGAVDGVASVASFRALTGIIAKNETEFYVTDYNNHKIRKIKIYRYTIAPQLPAGLVFNEQTGEISGTPTEVSPLTDYTVTAENENGTSSFVLSIEVNTLSTDSFNNSITKVYPNPFESELLFEFKNELPTEVLIFNVLGQEVLHFKPQELLQKIDFKNKLNGIYFAKIVFESKTEILQIIKK
ncbi:Por secretion system C-terminal sorting domain-containing protein [Flavobacterium haoranii]|uniref:Por secretion system C-terminal sorting domain-containing protein n=2 Tax=Flavobacterium haoranii TaxID=683124 RepID=A0A1M6ED02_9FLAO|nr:Por secretion system C-terminal sorting domain-containing protein [Flavobacterium haoranii]